jgi:hypothetical protein
VAGRAGALVLASAALSAASAALATDRPAAAVAAGAGGWAPSVSFDRSANTTHPLTGLSCTRSGFCLAVDSEGRTFVWTGSWHAATAIDRSVRYVTGLSCVTRSFCVAIGSTASPAAASSYAVRWTGGGWAAPVTLYAGRGGAALYGTVESVSCSSVTFCMAVGGQVGSEVFDGSHWTTHAGSTSGTDGQGSVGCAASDFCVNFHDGDANYWNGSAWRWTPSNSSVSSGAVPGVTSFVYGVSCLSARFCAAADLSGPPLIWNGRTWRRTSAAPNGGGGFGSVSCTTTSFCAAGGQTGRVATWNGALWTIASAPHLPAAPVLVSCSRTGVCVAVSADGASTHTGG